MCTICGFNRVSSSFRSRVIAVRVKTLVITINIIHKWWTFKLPCVHFNNDHQKFMSLYKEWSNLCVKFVVFNGVSSSFRSRVIAVLVKTLVIYLNIIHKCWTFKSACVHFYNDHQKFLSLYEELSKHCVQSVA